MIAIIVVLHFVLGYVKCSFGFFSDKEHVLSEHVGRCLLDQPSGFDSVIRFLSIIEIEGGVASCRVLPCVVDECCTGKPFYPIILMVIGENPEILFNFLVCSFRLTIGLGMIGGGEGSLDSDALVQFSRELGRELWSSIADDLVRQSSVGPDIVTE